MDKLHISQVDNETLLANAERYHIDPIYRKWWARRVADNDISLLVAEMGKEFVGRVCIVWGKPDEPEIAEYLPGVPIIMAAHVEPDFQSRGIGTRLMLSAEEIAKQRGKTMLVLNVAHDNPRAKSLYEKLGYRDWGHGDVTVRWQETHAGGKIVDVSEKCFVLTKQLENSNT